MLSCFRKQHHGISSDTASSSSSLLVLLFIHTTLEWIQSPQIQCVANYVRIRSHSTPEHLGSSRNSATFKEISRGRLKLIEQGFTERRGKCLHTIHPRPSHFLGGSLLCGIKKSKSPFIQANPTSVWLYSYSLLNAALFADEKHNFYDSSAVCHKDKFLVSLGRGYQNRLFELFFTKSSLPNKQ